MTDAERPEEGGFQPPASFDGFNVVRALGRGGMGHVYLGHDPMLDRHVALKFIASDQPGESQRDRFLIEARAIARLQHPNIVGIYRIGEVNGNPYIAYEFIAGEPLGKLVKPAPWSYALDIGLGIARGLAAAHERGVLHRDIKPANVMITSGGEVKLIDFGLAKLVDAQEPAGVEGSAGAAVRIASIDARDESAETVEMRAASIAAESITVTGALLGTPIFIAPELWGGQRATPAADVYALGLVLYELVAGTIPHADLRGQELVRAVLERDRPPVTTLCPGLPRAFGDVIDRCARRRPAERFASATEVAAALEAVRAVYGAFLDQRSGISFGEEDETVLVAASFARLAPRGDAFATRMYERLFDAHPELRALFPSDMSALRRKLIGALSLIVENLRKPDRLLPLLEQLGRIHAQHGVLPDHFAFLGEAMKGALADFEGDSWNESSERAWDKAYAGIAEAMKRGLLAEQPTPMPSRTTG